MIAFRGKKKKTTIQNEDGPADSKEGTMPTLKEQPKNLNKRRSELRLMAEEADIDFFLIELEVGEGPMRFAGKGERSLAQQLQGLDVHDHECFRNLKRRWEYQSTSFTTLNFSDEMFLRFARITAGKNGFNEERAWKCIKKFNKKRFMGLNAHVLETQLLTQTLFPVPGMRDKDGHEMFYMKPSRYFPKTTRSSTIINNLAYVMNTMLEKERPCRDGIGFLANMDDWTMENFHVDYCFKFMMTLQGFMVPVRVQLFLIVNPPSWFGAVWKIMKPMLAPSFRKKVKMISEDQLCKYLREGYEEFLPDDMESGRVCTSELVEDFVTYRKYLDELNPDFQPPNGDGSDALSRTYRSDDQSCFDEHSLFSSDTASAADLNESFLIDWD